VRRAILSVVIGLAGAGGVAASGWAIQAVALPPPKPAARVAADASLWFHEYRLVVDVFHFQHHRTKGACARTWFAGRNGSRVRASLLSFRGGPVLRVPPRRPVSVVRARRGRFPPGRLAADAGCSRTLAGMLAAAAQRNAHLTTERGYAANRPAIALEVQRGKGKRFTLYVSPRADRPLVAFVDLDGHEITARIYLVPVRRRVLTRFGILHDVLPEPMR
jgi:hypothetical protein